MTNPTPPAIATSSTAPTRRVVAMLVALLALQMALALILKFTASTYKSVEPTAPLLTCDFGRISKVVIEAPDSNRKRSKVLLERRQLGWVLPELYGSRASTDSVEQLLNSLKSLKKGFPVATTADAAERFKVSSSNFARAISLYDDHLNVTTLYLGSSPGFKSIYAKAPNSDDICTVELPEYQVSAKPEDWIDRSMAELNSTDITGVDMGTFKITKIGSKWTLSLQNQNKNMPESSAQSLVDAVAHVSINSVLGTTPLPDCDENAPALSYKVSLKDGKVVNYTFFKRKGTDAYVLKISNKDWYFAVDDWIVSRIKEMTPDSLLKRAAPDPNITKRP